MRGVALPATRQTKWQPRRPAALALAVVVLTVALAGCSEDAGGPTTAPIVDRDDIELAAGKGAIVGLLVDDRFRPIQLTNDVASTEFQAKGFVLLQETGEQVLTTVNGEFSFVDLPPGSYTLRVSASGHEAVPQRVLVTAGEFAEMSIVARRTSSEGSFVLTQEYSVFIPCSLRTIENGYVADCTLDQSGDSFRPGFYANYTQFGEAADAMVTEMKASKAAGMYRVQIRDDTTNPWIRWGTSTQFNVDYIKIVNEYGVLNEVDNWYGDNIPWENDRTMHVILFVGALLEQEAAELGFCCGVGVEIGIKAQFLQTVFVGELPVAVASYCVLC
jgi:hypothetical protein